MNDIYLPVTVEQRTVDVPDISPAFESLYNTPKKPVTLFVPYPLEVLGGFGWKFLTFAVFADVDGVFRGMKTRP